MPSVSPNLKTGPDALDSVATLKRDPTPSVPPKMCHGVQNMKTGHDALGNAENESGRAKHENVRRRLRYRRKRVRTPKMTAGAQNMKMGHDALSTAENESGREKRENGTRRPRYRRK
jgi:hypothetical protein